jgi:alpha-mannosidase
MPIPQEICVFFPCHTLEDFPTHLRDEAAAGVLTAWTAPWHPRVLATCGVIPTWHRADTPPVDLKGRLLLVPSAAESRMPSDLNGRIADAIECLSLKVQDRETTTKEILDYIGSPPAEPDDSEVRAENSGATTDRSDNNPLSGRPQTSAPQSDGPQSDGPQIGDFYALGYLSLQVQIMTRRLRYSSNLDLVVFAEHAIRAATAFCNGDSAAAADALHAAFDLLAEERDHYFSADPHLIDLVLVAPSTLGPPLEESLRGDYPLNLMVSAEVAEQIQSRYPAIADTIRRRIEAGSLALVGGCPDDRSRLESLSAAAVGDWINDALDRTEAALGSRPSVFGRLGGGIPGDLPPWLIAAGFRGAVTNDFASGIGWQDEAKMLWQSGGAEIEALTAKPLEVVQPHTFLAIGPRLGEAADAGQVSAALLVRWPGESRPASNAEGWGYPFMEDLRRSAKYSLALGRFWTLDRFFTHGERPYHSCTLAAATGDGVGLSEAVARDEPDPLSSAAKRFTGALMQQTVDGCRTLARLIDFSAAPAAEPNVEPDSEPTPETAAELAAAELAAALGFPVAADTSAATAVAVINPHCGAARGETELKGPPPASDTPGLFGSSRSGGVTRITIDVPGHGFATAISNRSASTKANHQKGFWGFLKKSKTLAGSGSLANEFLDVAIHPETGAIAAVHAGQQRGNRFSWQLAVYDADGPADGFTRMRCQQTKILQADASIGVIQTSGTLTFGDSEVGRFENRYTLKRGSRWLEIETDIQSLDQPLRDSPWRNYVAGRATWATDALSIRPLVRDKRHRCSGKRIEAPLGVVVDEGDRKMQVCSYGLPAHRRLGAKELDTLLLVRGESCRRFRLAYGFDVPNPTRSAIQHLAPPISVPLTGLESGASRGWLLDLDARTAVLSGMTLIDANTVRLTIVESSGKPTRTRIAMFRDIESAQRIGDKEPLVVEKGIATLRLSGHEIATVTVKLV